MGTPSVVVRNTAPSEIIRDGINGLVCEDTNESLCQAMEHYLFEISPEARDSMKKEARQSIPLPWETVMKEVEERYQALIARGRPKTRSIFSLPLK